MRANEFSFTDDDLRQAAHLLSQRMMASLPTPEECNEKPSPNLHAKIMRLIEKDLRKATFQRITKLVASILLCILLGCSTWLAVDVVARTAFFQWVREAYEESVLYRYFNDPADPNAIEALPAYTLSPLPEGYQETAAMGDDFIRMVIFDGPDGTIMLSYQRLQTGNQLEIHSAEFEPTSTSVGNIPADYYDFKDPETSNELVWIDESAEIAFRLIAKLGESEMVALANTVKITK